MRGFRPNTAIFDIDEKKEKTDMRAGYLVAQEANEPHRWAPKDALGSHLLRLI
jgi:hypothetical protein